MARFYGSRCTLWVRKKCTRFVSSKSRSRCTRCLIADLTDGARTARVQSLCHFVAANTALIKLSKHLVRLVFCEQYIGLYFAGLTANKIAIKSSSVLFLLQILILFQNLRSFSSCPSGQMESSLHIAVFSHLYHTFKSGCKLNAVL